MESTGETKAPKARARQFNMPDFLNDNNNNNITQEDQLPKLRPIGKIKSPFIEHVNNIMKTQQADKVEVRRNGSFNKVKVICKIEHDESTDTNGDSGKENNENGIVSEARKKFTRAMSLNSVPSLQKSSLLVPRERPTRPKSHVENKFAKYFGVQVKAELSPILKPNVLVNSKSFNQIGNHQQSFLSSTASNHTPSIKRRTEFRHQMISAKKCRSKTVPNDFPFDNRPGPITSFEDLQVTKEDLMNASKEFDKLFLGVE